MPGGGGSGGVLPPDCGGGGGWRGGDGMPLSDGVLGDSLGGETSANSVSDTGDMLEAPVAVVT